MTAAPDLDLDSVDALHEVAHALRSAADLLETAAAALTSPTGPLVYSVDQAATLLGISLTHAYDLIARGEFPIPTRQLGRRRLVPRAALDRYLNGNDAAEPDSSSP